MVTKLIVIILSVIVFTLAFKIDSSEHKDATNSIHSEDDIRQTYQNVLSNFNILSSVTNAMAKVVKIARENNERLNSEIFDVPGYIQTTEKISEEEYEHTTNIQDISTTDSNTIQQKGKEFTFENVIVIQDKEIATQLATNKTDLYTTTTNKPNEESVDETSNSNVEKHSDLLITAVNRDLSVTHDWSDICLDPAKDSDGMVPRSWGPGDVPNSDEYDDRMRHMTGCRSRMVPPYDRQPFHWDWPNDDSQSVRTDDLYYGDIATRSNRVLEYILAVRTVDKGRTDIKIYWNGQRKYYFAFSNTSNVVEFNRYSPYEQLWVGKFDDPLWSAEIDGDIVKREHYMPVQFTLGADKLTFRVGCSPPISLEEHQASIPTKSSDRIMLEIETSAYPAKLLYDCPIKTGDSLTA